MKLNSPIQLIAAKKEALELRDQLEMLSDDIERERKPKKKLRGSPNKPRSPTAAAEEAALRLAADQVPLRTLDVRGQGSHRFGSFLFTKAPPLLRILTRCALRLTKRL